MTESILNSPAATSVRSGVRPTTGKRRVYPFVKRGIYILSISAILALFVDGITYYAAPLPERPHHPDYRELRPAGSRGLVFGMAGTAMMIVMHLYSARKRFRWMRRLGRMQGWLDFHILLGVLGPLLILLHTSFKFNGLVSVGFWSMVAVSLSGFAGRYLFQQIPRSINGEKMSLEQVRRELEQLPVSAEHRYGLTKGALARIDDLSAIDYPKDAGAIRVLFWMLWNDVLLPLTIFRYRRELQLTLNVPTLLLDELARLVRQQALLRRRVIYWQQFRRLFHHWHIVHKPFAIVMYVIMAIHIGVAVWTGYGWFY